MVNPVLFSNIPGKFNSTTYPSPSQGSGFTDGIRVGTSQSSSYNNGYQGIQPNPYVTTQINFGTFNPLQPGSDALTALANVGIGYVNITAPKISMSGQQVVKLTAPRCIYAFFNTTGPTTAIFAQIWGFDAWGIPMCERIDFVTGAGAAGRLQQGKKAFGYVYAIYVSAATSGNGGPIIFYGGSRFGLSYLCQDPGSVVPYLRGILGAQSSATPIDASINFTSGAKVIVPVNIAPGLTASAQTLTSQDPRGWVDVLELGSGPAGTLVIHQAVMGAGRYDSANLNSRGYPTQSVASLYGLPQFNAPLI